MMFGFTTKTVKGRDLEHTFEARFLSIEEKIRKLERENLDALMAIHGMRDKILRKIQISSQTPEETRPPKKINPGEPYRKKSQV